MLPSTIARMIEPNAASGIDNPDNVQHIENSVVPVGART
jgi:hypothetical protein